MAKTVIDWKAPSEKQMKDVVKELSNEKKKSFATACVVVKEGKNTINKSKAKNWLRDNCADLVEWKNAPKNVKAKSSADEIAEWLAL